MLLLLDTNVLIRLDEVRLPAGDIVLSTIAYSELRFGIENATTADVRRSRIADLARLTARVGTEWLPYDKEAAAGYAHLAARVAAHRPAHARSKDIMLAGHAYSLGASIVTFNVKDFALVSDRVDVIAPQLRR